MIVPDDKLATTDALERNDKFGVEPRSRRTWYNASNGLRYCLDVLEPSSIYQQFNSGTETVIVDGIKILKPSLILNFKCLSWVSMDRRQQKRSNDAYDIKFQ